MTNLTCIKLDVYDRNISECRPRDPKVVSFLEDILSVCEKHNLSISHEDCHGGFVIESLSKDNLTWLGAASEDIE